MLRRLAAGRRDAAAGAGRGARDRDGAADRGRRGDDGLPGRDVPAEGAGADQFTFLQHGAVVRGSLEATGRVRLHGRIEGDVRVRGVLEVAEDGEVVGATVEVDELKVLGVVRAAVVARVRVELWKGATLEGDVTTPALDVEEGATFVGRSAMPRRAEGAHALRPPPPQGEHAAVAGPEDAPDERPEGPGGARVAGAAGG